MESAESVERERLTWRLSVDGSCEELRLLPERRGLLAVEEDVVLDADDDAAMTGRVVVVVAVVAVAVEVAGLAVEEGSRFRLTMLAQGQGGGRGHTN